MIKIRARIELYKDGRRTPFRNGYRPLFNFIKEMKVSGHIKLTDRAEFLPGDIGVVEITFIDNKYLGKDFRVGAKFTFGENITPLGEGEVVELFR